MLLVYSHENYNKKENSTIKHFDRTSFLVQNNISFCMRMPLLCFDLLTRPKMPFKVMHRKEVTHSNGSYEKKSHGRKLADEMGRAKKNSHGTLQSDAPEESDL